MDEAPEERAAARVVGEVLGVPTERIDGVRPGSGQPDYELHFASGARPLEVTTLTDGTLRSFWAAVAKHGRHVPGSVFSWWIATTYDPINVPALNEALAEVLPPLEVRGVREFGDMPGASPTPPLLADLGVVRGRVVHARGENGEPILFHTKSGTFVTNRDVLIEVCEREVASNREKLGEGGHLFIWVETLADEAWVGMDLDRPPEEEPAIPAGLTVWLARTSGPDWEPDLIWRVSPEAGWESLIERRNSASR
jgi:hypothetical protein